MPPCAPGVAAAGTAIFAVAVLGEQLIKAAVATGLGGACIGFLALQQAVASIFMGDAGSLFLGFVLAVTPRHEPGADLSSSFAVPLMLMGLPVLDTVTVTLSRLRRGRSVALGGRDHLSHRLVALGLSPGAAVRVLVAVEGTVGMLAVLVGRGWWPLAGAAAAASVLGSLTLATFRAPVYQEVVAFPRRVKELAASHKDHMGLLALTAPTGVTRAARPREAAERR